MSRTYQVSVKQLLLLGALMWLAAGCSEPPRAKDLEGHWLQKFERRGFDFSDQGLAARYSLAPQRVSIHNYRLEKHELLLEDPTTSFAEQIRLPISLDRTHLQIEVRPGVYENFEQSPVLYEPSTLPELVGLWRSQEEGSKEVWVFNQWGTVFANVEISPGRYEGLWARFQLQGEDPRDRGKQTLKLWGIQGELALDGRDRSLYLKGDTLKLGENSYRRDRR